MPIREEIPWVNRTPGEPEDCCVPTSADSEWDAAMTTWLFLVCGGGGGASAEGDRLWDRHRVATWVVVGVRWVLCLWTVGTATAARPTATPPAAPSFC